jgi:hypothetical protein
VFTIRLVLKALSEHCDTTHFELQSIGKQFNLLGGMINCSLHTLNVCKPVMVMISDFGLFFRIMKTFWHWVSLSVCVNSIVFIGLGCFISFDFILWSQSVSSIPGT